MNRTEILATVHRLLRDTVLGCARHDTQLLLVAEAIACNVEIDIKPVSIPATLAVPPGDYWIIDFDQLHQIEHVEVAR